MIFGSKFVNEERGACCLKDNTFVWIGIIIAITLLIIMVVVSTSLRMYMYFIGVICILEVLCFACHRIINDKE